MGEIAMRTLRSFRKLVTPACLLGIAVPTLALAQSATTAPPAQQVRFAGAIQEFLDNDKTSPPPEEGILFIGSNIFCQWSTVVEDMAPPACVQPGVRGIEDLGSQRSHGQDSAPIQTADHRVLLR